MPGLDRRRWAEQSVVITGGSQGIGLAVATELAGSCHSLTLMARDGDRLRGAASQLGCAMETIDVRSADALATSPALAQASTVICCAGDMRPGRVAETGPEVYAEQMAVNFVGTTNTVCAALPGMLRRGVGTLVLMGSTASMLGIYGYTAYGPTKAAIASYAAALRAEVRRQGIRVVVAYPPDTQTPGLDRERALRPPETSAIVGTIAAKPAPEIARKLVRRLEVGAESVAFDPLTAFLLWHSTFPDRIATRYSDWMLRRMAQHGPVAPDIAALQRETEGLSYG